MNFKQYISTIKGKASLHKTLIQNFSYLSAIQVFNLLVPLITYPYLIRILGKETYGLVVFAQAIITYLLIFVSFGFNISATKEISIHRDNKEKLNEIVSSILMIKSLLFILSLAMLGCLLIFIPSATGHEALFLLSMIICLTDILFPIWYFQGIEQMKYITYITLISRLTFLVLIFILIQSPKDYLLVPAIYGIGYLIAGITALFIIFSKHKIRFYFQPFRTLKNYFIDSIPIFVSNISVSLYVSTNKVIAGTFLGLQEVAYYDLAEKLTSVLKIPQSILSQSLFPKISKEKDTRFVKQIFTPSVIVNIILFLLTLIFSKYIILILGGEQMLPARIVVNILALTVPIIAVSNIVGFQLLIPFGYSREFSRVIVSSGFIYLLQLGLLWITFGYSITTLSIVTVITEIFVSSYMFYYCKKYHLWK